MLLKELLLCDDFGISQPSDHYWSVPCCAKCSSKRNFYKNSYLLRMASSRDDVPLSRRRRVSYEQLECLWEFLNSHRDVAMGYNKSAQAREYSKRLWVSVSEALNSLGEGATKDWKGWSSYWVDYKAKLKRRVAALRASRSRTGGGPSEGVPLNDIEKKFLSLFGEGFGSGLPNVQVDPFPNLTQSVLVEPVAGPSHSASMHPLDLEVPLTQEEHQSEDVLVQPLPQQESRIPSPQQGQAPLSQQQQPEEAQSPRRILRRRRRRQAALSQQMAREMLVDISRTRMLTDQRISELLSQIAVAQQTNTQTMLNISGTLNRIEAAMNRSTGAGGPETRDEGVPDC